MPALRFFHMMAAPVMPSRLQVRAVSQVISTMSEGAGRGGVRCGILQECADSCGAAHDTNKLLLTPARLPPALHSAECNGRHAAAESITNVPVVHAKLDVLHKVEVLQRQISGRHGEVQWRHMMKSCAAHKR
jgi:hypothetical protein